MPVMNFDNLIFSFCVLKEVDGMVLPGLFFILNDFSSIPFVKPGGGDTLTAIVTNIRLNH